MINGNLNNPINIWAGYSETLGDATFNTSSVNINDYKFILVTIKYANKTDDFKIIPTSIFKTFFYDSGNYLRMYYSATPIAAVWYNENKFTIVFNQPYYPVSIYGMK